MSIPEAWRWQGQFRILRTEDGPDSHLVQFGPEGISVSFPRFKFKVGDRVRFYTVGEHYPHIYVPEGTLGTVEAVAASESGDIVDVYPDGFPREHEFLNRQTGELQMYRDEWNGCYVWAPDAGEDAPFEHVGEPLRLLLPWSMLVPVRLGITGKQLDVLMQQVKVIEGDEKRKSLPVRSAMTVLYELYTTWRLVFEALYYHVCTFRRASRTRPDELDEVFYACRAIDEGEGLVHEQLLRFHVLRNYYRDVDVWLEGTPKESPFERLTPAERSEVRVAFDWHLEHGRDFLLRT